MIDPLKFSFDKVVKITTIMFKFIKSFNCMKNKLKTTKESTNKFQMFKDITGFSLGEDARLDRGETETVRKVQLISKFIHPPLCRSYLSRLEELRANMPNVHHYHCGHWKKRSGSKVQWKPLYCSQGQEVQQIIICREYPLKQLH